ncbi:MAG TPA: GNAT family N-acetyltransferase [bacterium]|nr:GNAT family N-acetyltransferase [bacterium]HPN45607.1 GNAT family N-acetyltransferase [bacterium]
MVNLQTLTIKDFDKWRGIIQSSVNYDFYHLPCYHALAEERGEGTAYLYVYRKNQYMIALPLLVRPVQEVPGLEILGKDLWDATSVYGYAGPVFSHFPIPEDVINGFHDSLRQVLLQNNIITVFSRLHTFIPQADILNGLGTISVSGVTVSIDLTLPIDVQRHQYSKGHKSGINKLRELGVECYHDEKMEYLDDFIDIYYETMNRVNAEKYYYFNKAYFERLISCLGAQVHHFMCTLKGKIICSGMYVRCNDMVQSHLGGTRTEFMPLAPRKLEKDTVRIWATRQGARIFHLGGGLGAKRDSLYTFKAGFSKKRHDFKIWKWVVNPEIYENLCTELGKDQYLEKSNGEVYNNSYFPVYRNYVNI